MESSAGWQSLAVYGIHWICFNTIIPEDSTFNDTAYSKRVLHNGNFAFERNTDVATYCRDIYDCDENSLTTELMWDSLAAETPYAHFSYHNPDGTPS